MFLPVFMDGSLISILPSTFLPVFMDGTRAFMRGTGCSSGYRFVTPYPNSA